MKIAIIGWGSLIKEPRELPIDGVSAQLANEADGDPKHSMSRCRHFGSFGAVGTQHGDTTCHSKTPKHGLPFDVNRDNSPIVWGLIAYENHISSSNAIGRH